MKKTPARGILDHLPDGTYTRREAAAKIGKSYDTVRRWHETGRYKSTRSEQVGTLIVYLYDDKDIREMKKLARTIKPGRQVT